MTFEVKLLITFVATDPLVILIKFGRNPIKHVGCIFVKSQYWSSAKWLRNTVQCTWITLLLLCTRVPLVLCCNQFDRGSRRVKRDPVDLVMEDYDIQGCESSSFQLISSFLKIFLCQNSSFFFYFQPIFGIFPRFHAVFPRFLPVALHTSDWRIDGGGGGTSWNLYL